MFCCHSASRRETIRASLPGCATIAGVRPDVAGRFDLKRQRRADALGSDHVVDPAALVLDFDDLAHRRPIAERLMLVATAETRTDRNGVGIIDPLDGLQLR